LFNHSLIFLKTLKTRRVPSKIVFARAQWGYYSTSGVWYKRTVNVGAVTYFMVPGEGKTAKALLRFPKRHESCRAINEGAVKLAF
jgi:hypothetical protein